MDTDSGSKEIMVIINPMVILVKLTRSLDHVNLHESHSTKNEMNGPKQTAVSCKELNLYLL